MLKPAFIKADSILGIQLLLDISSRSKEIVNSRE